MYQNYSCEQLALEARRLGARRAGCGRLGSKAIERRGVTTVGVIVFWPVLFALKGDGATAAELAQLKGQMNAIEQASIVKKCNIQFQKQAAPPKAEPVPEG